MKTAHKKIFLNLYQKFALAIIVLGILPMSLVANFLVRNMTTQYQKALEANYEQAAEHCSSSLENLISVYDNVSKMIYDYNHSTGSAFSGQAWNTDSLRQVISGEIYDKANADAARSQDMTQFLRSLTGMDNYIYAAHFTADAGGDKTVSFHFSPRSTYFTNEELFEKAVRYDMLDRESRKLMIQPPHPAGYLYGVNKQVFTLSRNYYDLRGEIAGEKYIGTVYLDIDEERIRLLFKTLALEQPGNIYILDGNGQCIFSTSEEAKGKSYDDLKESLSGSGWKLLSETGFNAYGLKTAVAVNTSEAYAKLHSTRNTMFLILAASAFMLVLASFYFSRRMTRPMHRMMDEMSRVENGDFDIELPVESRDEIGILSDRFNRMSGELKNYINQSYVAQIRQNEAELTALKSQIYPHFLYNTLEVIRMEAVENDDTRVSSMIEALSEQIHYLIGPVKDMVPLGKETEIVRKYVYLLNCRVQGKILLTVEIDGLSQVRVPKLILQPIVENAYVHGIKPKNGKGSISISAEQKEEDLEISVMDNGAGMDETTLEKLSALLSGTEPGIKNEYNWQSIGLKNVHDRIRYLYGEKYGIKVTSTPGVGTIVTIVLPCMKTEDT